jgi:hypothetical protein
MTAGITRYGVLVCFMSVALITSAGSPAQRDDVDGAYVIAEVAGEAVCREATAAEALELNQGPKVPVYVFGEESGKLRSNAAGSTHLNIILRGTEQLEANAEAKAAFERAAEIWESVIANPITIYVDVDYGPKRFGEDWPSASVIASAGTPSYIYPKGTFEEFRPLLIGRADDAHELSVYNALPVTEFTTDAGNISAFGGGGNVLRVFGLEQFPTEAASTDPASSIGFNSAFAYDFNPDDGIAAGKKDFVGVVVHEIGHMLGFSSRVGGKETASDPTKFTEAPAILDMFRFRPGVNMATFTTADRILTTGGEQVFYGGRVEHGLSTGNPRGENGDQQQASHWKDDGQSGIHIGVMDPTIPNARRIELTRGDFEAFGLFGYSIVHGGCRELESNDSFEDASEVPFGTPCNGTTGITGEGTHLVKSVKLPNGTTAFVQDFFKVTLPGAAKLSVSLSFTTTGADLNLLLLRGDNSLLASSAGSGTTETLESATLDAGTYYIGISSALGTSPYTLTVTPIGLKPPAPNAPTTLRATPAGSASIRLNWADNSSNEADFRIEQRTGSTWAEIAIAAANATSYTVSGLSADSAYAFRVRARNEGGDSAYTSEASAKTLVATGACVTTATTVCLAEGRFRVVVDYLNQFASPAQAGTMLGAKLLPGAQNPDTATFGFGSAQNIEVVVRIGDTRPFGLSRFDVYYGGMTDVEYSVTVQDMQTGTTRVYRNPPGNVGAGLDRVSFPTNGTPTEIYAFANASPVNRAPIALAPVAPRPCVAGSNAICLLDGRFEVKIDFLNQFASPPAPGSMVGAKLLPGSQNPDTAIFGFGSAQAIESVVRIQDARPFGVNRFDIYVGGMSDIEYRVTVLDTVTGVQRQYHNPPGTVGGIVDRTSFAATN